MLERYDPNKHQFGDTEGPGLYFDMPPVAVIHAAPVGSLWYDAKGITHLVQVSPVALWVRESDVFPCPNFPPTGPHFIKKDGEYDPPNLPELVAARIEQGWIVPNAVRALLGLPLDETHIELQEDF